MIKSLKIIIFIAIVLFLLSIDFSGKKEIEYGASFSRFHTDELKLDWKEVYLAMLNDLGIRRFRFSAHWPVTEPKKGLYDFTELDFQIKEAEAKNAKVILAVGRRLPGWPECHIPEWAGNLSFQEQKPLVLNLIKVVVERYKNSPAIEYWQVENEPYLTFFGRSSCGELDEEFLDEEIKLVKELDPGRKILVTDSGEFGPWFQAYRKGDVFGTSQYLYIWWKEPIGPFRYPITPGFFRIKENIVRWLFGEKEILVIELSAEPWLRKPIIDTSLDVQMERMGIDKFNEMIEFSAKTNLGNTYLWGAEWWYWLKKNDRPEHWDRARELFNQI